MALQRMKLSPKAFIAAEIYIMIVTVRKKSVFSLKTWIYWRFWQSPRATLSLCHFLSSSSSGDSKWIYVYVVAQKTLYCTLPAEPVTQADVFPSTPLSLAKLYDGNWYKHCDRVSG